MVNLINFNFIKFAVFIIAFIVMAFVTFLLLETHDDVPKNKFVAHRVAHAGGGISNDTYTNSYNALNENITLGFVYFEIDFSFTKDNELVCLHDWEGSFKRSFGYTTDSAVTLKEFERLADSQSKYQKCTLFGLARWMDDYPNAVLVTDVKDNNLEALSKIYHTIPNASARVIPQIYTPDNFNAVKNIGFENIIWTLYRYIGSDKDVIEKVPYFSGNFAVTMPKYKAERGLSKSLESLGVPTYVHTINTTEESEYYLKEQGVTELYTDFLPPN